MAFFSKYTSDFYRSFSWLLFILLFVYLILRAAFVAPLHDEVATLFHFVEPGVLWGDDMLVDANNHLLNSFLCRGIYLLFGDGFFMLRLPNVLAFILFFWGIVRLIKPIQINFTRTMLLLALTCIPFILEYFANARGYGLSLAFFVCTLVYLRGVAKLKKVRYAYLAYGFLVLAIYANLTFMVSGVLALMFILLLQVIYRADFNLRRHLLLLMGHVLFAVTLLPAYFYAQRLRTGEALYYGSLKGFWQVTGKTLTENVLFYNEDWMKWFFLLTAAGFIIFLVYNWRLHGTWKFFRRSDTIFAWFLFGNCIAIMIMAREMHINYPEDRVGMYLVILFLLLLGFIIGREKRSAWIMSLFLFFPISFVTRINLSTSVFSPDDRMSEAFFNDVMKYTVSNTTVSAYPLMQLTWAYQDRERAPETVAMNEKAFNFAADIVLTKTTLYGKEDAFLANYDTIAYDPNSTFIAYRKHFPHRKTTIYDTVFRAQKTSDEFIPIYTWQMPDSLKSKYLQFRVRGDVQAKPYKRELNLVFSTFSDSAQPVRYKYWNEHWTHGLKEQFHLNYNYAVTGFNTDEKEARIYLWNPFHEEVEVKNGIFEIIILE